MTTGLYTTAEIRARLDAGYPDWADTDSDHWDWDTTLDDIIDRGDHRIDEDSVRAFLQYLDGAARHEEPFTPEEFAEELQRRYKFAYSSMGKFARECAAPEWVDMGDQPRGRAVALKEFADFINWDAYAASDDFLTGWAAVRLPGDDVVHVFEED
jgi:hypothetical protein